VNQSPSVTVGSEAADVGNVGPIVHLRLSVTRSPWRISPAWSVVAGALAGGTAYFEPSALLRLFAMVLLTELAWGSLWRLSAKGASRRVAGSGKVVLPYAMPGAPIAKLNDALIERTEDGAIRSGWYDLALGLVLSGALSLLLGQIALVLSLLAVGISLAAWFLSRRGGAAALPLAILAVGLPWLLGASAGSRVPAELLELGPWIYILTVVYTVLQWGVLRAETSNGRTGLLWFGQALALGAAVGMGAPWLTVLLAALLLVPMLRVMGSLGSNVTLHARLRYSAPWWWAAMMLSAFALRLLEALTG
jgi:hypothetical protein